MVLNDPPVAAVPEIFSEGQIFKSSTEVLGWSQILTGLSCKLKCKKKLGAAVGAQQNHLAYP